MPAQLGVVYQSCELVVKTVYQNLLRFSTFPSFVFNSGYVNVQRDHMTNVYVRLQVTPRDDDVTTPTFTFAIEMVHGGKSDKTTPVTSKSSSFCV